MVKETELAKSITDVVTADEGPNTDVAFSALALAPINFSLQLGMAIDRFCDATSGYYQDMLDRTGAVAPTAENTSRCASAMRTATR